MLNIFDIGIILLLILSVIVGFKRGVIKELVSLIGIIIVFILSWNFKGVIGDLLCTVLPFFKFSGSIQGLVTINILFYQIIAFIFIFSILSVIYTFSLKISRFVQKVVNLTIVLWLPSKLLGAVVSLIKGYLILFVVFVLLMIPMGNFDLFRNSSMIDYMLYKTPLISSYTSSFTSPVSDVYALSKSVSNNEISVNDANLEAIDIMLKYDVTSKEMINRLVKLHKLDDITNIYSVLNKY